MSLKDDQLESSRFSSEIQIKMNGVTYHWFGGLGNIFYSYEKGIKVGDIRDIGGIYFTATYVYKSKPWQKLKVCWSIPDVDCEWIRKLKKKIIGTD